MSLPLYPPFNRNKPLGGCDDLLWDHLDCALSWRRLVLHCGDRLEEVQTFRWAIASRTMLNLSFAVGYALPLPN